MQLQDMPDQSRSSQIDGRLAGQAPVLRIDTLGARSAGPARRFGCNKPSTPDTQLRPGFLRGAAVSGGMPFIGTPFIVGSLRRAVSASL